VEVPEDPGVELVPEVSFFDLGCFLSFLFDGSGFPVGEFDIPGVVDDPGVFGLSDGFTVCPGFAGVVVPGVEVPGAEPGVEGLVVVGGVEVPGPGVPGVACPHTKEAPRTVRAGISIRPYLFFIYDWLLRRALLPSGIRECISPAVVDKRPARSWPEFAALKLHGLPGF